MAIIRGACDPRDQIESVTNKYRSREELAIRDALEEWGRARLPVARQYHELVVGRGVARADLAFIEPDNLECVEIKSSRDGTMKLFEQAAMFSLAAPRVWICVAPLHKFDAEIMTYLLPFLGLIEASQAEKGSEKIRLDVIREAQPRQPLPKALLTLLWVAELATEAERHRLIQRRGKPPTHGLLVKLLADALTRDEQMEAVCRQLRARQTMWRADPPVREGA